MSRRVEIQPGADDDIRRITGYIARRVSPRSAANWHVRIRVTIGRLADDADQWGEADEVADVASTFGAGFTAGVRTSIAFSSQPTRTWSTFTPSGTRRRPD